MLSLLRTRVNVLPVTALVRMSANWSSDLTNGSSILLSSIFTLMKCLSISTCLVLSCCTGFSEILILALLSHFNRLGSYGGKPISVINFLIYKTSVIPLEFSGTQPQHLKEQPLSASDNPHGNFHIILLRLMHKLAYYPYCICYIWSSV